MTKAEMVEYVATKAGLTKADATRALDAVVESLKKGVKDTGRVAVSGLGTFNKKHRPAKVGRNPRTGEPMKYEAKNSVSFKPSSTFKAELN